MDISKTFDNIDHSALLEKLKYLEIKNLHLNGRVVEHNQENITGQIKQLTAIGNINCSSPRGKIYQ